MINLNTDFIGIFLYKFYTKIIEKNIQIKEEYNESKAYSRKW